jgi:hypothetical protein
MDLRRPLLELSRGQIIGAVFLHHAPALQLGCETLGNALTPDILLLPGP